MYMALYAQARLELNIKSRNHKDNAIDLYKYIYMYMYMALYAQVRLELNFKSQRHKDNAMDLYKYIYIYMAR